jgi:hypothetical protein
MVVCPEGRAMKTAEGNEVLSFEAFSRLVFTGKLWP